MHFIFILFQLGRSSVKFSSFMDHGYDRWNICAARNLFFLRNNILPVVPGDGKFYVFISIENICTR